jgi:hypothetical protein
MDINHPEYVCEFYNGLFDKSIIGGIRPNPYFVRQGDVSFLVDEEQARDVRVRMERLKRDSGRMNISLQCENIDKLTVEQMANGHCDNHRYARHGITRCTGDL